MAEVGDDRLRPVVDVAGLGDGVGRVTPELLGAARTVTEEAGAGLAGPAVDGEGRSQPAHHRPPCTATATNTTQPNTRIAARAQRRLLSRASDSVDRPERRSPNIDPSAPRAP